MKEEIKTPLLVVAIVGVLAVAGFFGFRAVNSAGNLDKGQVEYTPGVPPWEEKDPSKKGPGAGPGGDAPPVGAPAINNSGK